MANCVGPRGQRCLCGDGVGKNTVVPVTKPGRFGNALRMKNWILLLIAAALEVAWAIGLKHTAGFTRLWPSVATIAGMAASMYLLALAARALPIGTAYAVWTGI